jgi:hypothetical protein
VFQNLNYQVSAKPVVNPVTNISTRYSDLTQNIGPARNIQLGLKLYF